jgi:glycine/D-amino acid oxidase-like deaminating enzyme
MDLKSGQLYWPLKNGLLGTYPILKHDLACEVAIIGAGVTGALVARELCDAGVETIVLDRRDAGWGSTSASTCLLQYEVDTHLTDLKKLVGERDAVRSYLLCLESIGTIERIVATLDDDCGFARRPSVYLASRKRDVQALRDEWEARREAGIRVDFLDQAAVEARFPFSRPAALLSADGAQVDAYRLTHYLLRYAQQRGVCVFDRTAVARFEAHADGVTLVTDRDWRVRARSVVFAAGYEAQQYLRRKVVDLKSTYALVSEPLASFDGWFEQCLLWESARPYLYARTTDDGRALVGGLDEPFRNPVLRDKLIERKAGKLADSFRELFPALDFDVAYAWAGTFGETKDGLAYIGATEEFPHAFFALGYGGNGITYSAIAARIITDAVRGLENDDARIFRFDR